MTEVFGTITIKAPYSVAMDAIVRRLKAKKNRIVLEVPFKKIGIPTNLGIEREVDIAFHPVHGYKGEQQLHDELRFTWVPTGGGPFPTFGGMLKLRPLGADTECILSGEYQPPGGKLGEAFDAVIGKRIAEATSNVLLDQIRQDVEADFAAMKEAVERSPHRE